MAVTRQCFGLDFSFGTVTDTITGLYSVYLSHIKAYLHVRFQSAISQ
jgi:hypothetical protein